MMVTGELEQPVEALVERARHGELDAFAALYERYRWPIQRYLYRLLSDWEQAEDLTQDTFVRAWRALPNASPLTVRLFQPWVYRIATNLATDAHRHAGVVQWMRWDAYLATPHPTQEAPDHAEDSALRQELSDEVRAILQQLSPSHRRILVLAATLDASYEELGARLGLTRIGVKSLLFRARWAYRVAMDASLVRPFSRLPAYRGITMYRDGRARPYKATAGPRRQAVGCFATMEEASAALNAFYETQEAAA